jgi:hypothetical protein
MLYLFLLIMTMVGNREEERGGEGGAREAKGESRAKSRGRPQH